jgi:histone H3/H4
VSAGTPLALPVVQIVFNHAAGGRMSANAYSQALARVAVAQLAELSGVESCQESAVDILADLLVRYAQQLCVGARDYAETAGRTEFNVVDVLLSLDDMGVTSDELRQYLDLQVGQVDAGVPHCMEGDAAVCSMAVASLLRTWCTPHSCSVARAHTV